MTTPPGGPENYPDHSPSHGPGQGPDYLDHTSTPVPATDDKRKRLLALGGVVGAGVIIGGGAWAATSFFATGEQPAEALPASTIAYASVDLDPSGGQKIEAVRTLKKFPAFDEEIDLETDEDLRERMFEEITSSGECEGLDYAKDVKPWLGSRAAVAAIDAGEEQPSPVVVVQVTDSGAAEKGMDTLLETCGEGDSETGAWTVEGDWLVAAETDEIVDKVVKDAAESSLADDEGFSRWTSEAGDEGIMSFYVSEAAADYYYELLTTGMAGGPMAMSGIGADTVAGVAPGPDGVVTEEELWAAEQERWAAAEEGREGLPEELQQMLDDFEGGAATVRFDDGALEIEYAMSDYQPELSKLFANEEGVDLVSTLPADTVAAFGLGLEEDWVQGIIDYVEKFMPEGEEMSVDDMLAEAEAETGLTLPEDIETLFGDGVAVAVGPGIDPDAIADGGPGEVPAGIRIAGDPGEIQEVLDKLKATAGDPEIEPFLEVTEGDGFAVLALKEAYRSDLADKGSLGDSAAYQEVMDDTEAQSVLFVDFDADDGWLVRVSEEDPEISENLEPLSAVGVSAWVDDEVLHSLVKLTTD